MTLAQLNSLWHTDLQEEARNLYAISNKEKIPVTPCGARTGLSGGSLPIMGGVALSTEKLNNIISIN